MLSWFSGDNGSIKVRKKKQLSLVFFDCDIIISVLSGCSIVVVRKHGVFVVRVRFSVARLCMLY